jgi:hypothetical protein
VARRGCSPQTACSQKITSRHHGAQVSLWAIPVTTNKAICAFTLHGHDPLLGKL